MRTSWTDWEMDEILTGHTPDSCKNKEELHETMAVLNIRLHEAMMNLGNCIRATGEAHQPKHAEMDFERIKYLAERGVKVSKLYNEKD